MFPAGLALIEATASLLRHFHPCNGIPDVSPWFRASSEKKCWERSRSQAAPSAGHSRGVFWSLAPSSCHHGRSPAQRVSPRLLLPVLLALSQTVLDPATGLTFIFHLQSTELVLDFPVSSFQNKTSGCYLQRQENR